MEVGNEYAQRLVSFTSMCHFSLNHDGRNGICVTRWCESWWVLTSIFEDDGFRDERKNVATRGWGQMKVYMPAPASQGATKTLRDGELTPCKGTICHPNWKVQVSESQNRLLNMRCSHPESHIQKECVPMMSLQQKELSSSNFLGVTNLMLKCGWWCWWISLMILLMVQKSCTINKTL